MKLHFGPVGFARDNARRGPASVCLVCKNLRHRPLGIVACRMALSHNLEARKIKRNYFEKYVRRLKRHRRRTRAAGLLQCSLRPRLRDR